MTKPASALFTVASLIVALPMSTSAATITVPGTYENAEANCTACQNAFPFAATSATGMRYQQIFDAAAFSSQNSPFYITEIWFRPDRINGSPFSAQRNVQINLSTTSATVNLPGASGNSGLSVTFADNIGIDETLVYSGSLMLSSTDTPSGDAASPRIFDIGIIFQTAFLYDPSLGNLLLDVRNFGGTGSSTSMDAASFFQDPVSRIFSANVNATAATNRDTSGLIARFEVEQVPEVPLPSAVPLFLSVLASGGIVSWWRRRREPA